MEKRSLPQRRIVAYARPESFAENTLEIMSRLGCEILTPGEFAEDVCARGAPSTPDLYLADVGRLSELPDTDMPSAGDEHEGPFRVPVVVLVRDRESPVQDARVAASVRSPAGMHDLYCVLQQVLEEKPRSTPRVETQLPAVCRRTGLEWSGTVVSLSENGCLLATDETVELGTELLLSFPIPQFGKINVHAEAAYQIKSELGLVFSSASPKMREGIGSFVERTLLAQHDAADPATATGSR